MARNSTQVRVYLKDLSDLKSIRDELSEKWERQASYPDAIHFLIREYQRSQSKIKGHDK